MRRLSRSLIALADLGSSESVSGGDGLATPSGRLLGPAIAGAARVAIVERAGDEAAEEEVDEVSKSISGNMSRIPGTVGLVTDVSKNRRIAC